MGMKLHQVFVDAGLAAPQILIAALSEPGALPALVHCSAGKDRTGVMIALLLGVARVPTATIVEDYALSARYLNETFLAEARQRVETSGGDWSAYAPLLDSPAAVMREMLTYLDERYGGIAAFLSAIGVSDDELEAVRAALTE